jgi:hypothetical protein
MLNHEFDPFEILQLHDTAINELITAHNDVAKLAEELAQQNQNLNERMMQIERLIYEIKSIVDLL